MSTGSSNSRGQPAKQCPVCGRQYPLEFRFCKDDAATLTEISSGAVDEGVRAEAAASAVSPVGGGSSFLGKSVESFSRSPGGKTKLPTVIGAVAVIAAILGGSWILASHPATDTLPVPPSVATTLPGSGSRDMATVRGTASAPLPAAAGGGIAGWKEYAHDEGRFSIHLPPGWQDSAAEKQSDFTRWRWVSPDDPRVTVTADLDLARHGVPPLAVWRDLDARFAKAYKERYTRLGLEGGKLDGESAAIWTFRVRKKGEPELTKIDYGVTFGDGTGFALMLSAPPDKIGHWKPIFDEVVAHFGWYGD